MQFIRLGSQLQFLCLCIRHRASPADTYPVLSETLFYVIDSCNFVICPLLHSPVIYFWWRSGEYHYSGLKPTLDKRFSTPIVHTVAQAPQAQCWTKCAFWTRWRKTALLRQRSLTLNSFSHSKYRVKLFFQAVGIHVVHLSLALSE